MTTTDTDQFTLLHLLKVKGLAPADGVAASLGQPVDSVEPQLRQLVVDELVKYRDGRVTGYALTAGGRNRLTELREGALDADAIAAVEQAYEQFLGINKAFKELTTDWQMREPGSDTAALHARLADLHTKVNEVDALAAAGVPRFATYDTRFAAALQRLQGGDDSAFARPMSDSYHDVWMELHEDLLSTTGKQRTEADE